MYDFRSVNVAAIRGAIESLKSNFSYQSLDNVFNNLSSNDAWESPAAKLTFFNGLNINKGYMEKFKAILDNALSICSQIERWQTLYKEMADHTLRANTAKNNMTYTVRQYYHKGTPEETYELKTYIDHHQETIYNNEQAAVKRCREEQINIENRVKSSLPLVSLGR